MSSSPIPLEYLIAVILLPPVHSKIVNLSVSVTFPVISAQKELHNLEMVVDTISPNFPVVTPGIENCFPTSIDPNLVQFPFTQYVPNSHLEVASQTFPSFVTLAHFSALQKSPGLHSLSTVQS